MQFLNPAVLAGLVAALIPLAIHLLHRGRTSPLPFSNLAFLRRLHHSRMRRVRLRQWLVLLLRTLIIALLICAFARPSYRSGGGWGGRSRSVLAVVLLDLSYSTGYRLPGGAIFTQLQRRVLELLDLFAPRDEVAVIPFASQPHFFDDGSVDLEHLGERIRELTPGEEATDLKTALQAAYQRLDARPEVDRELFLFTDLAHHNWPELDAQRPLLQDIRVYVGVPDASAEETAPRDNLHVDDVRSLSWMPAVGKKLGLQVLLTNSSPRAASAVSLDLYVDAERVRHQDIDLVSGEQARVEFTITPRRSGRLSGYVELEDDPLLLDNRRYFTLDVPDRIDVLLLGGQPADTYYPRRALIAAVQADPALAIHSGLFADLSGEKLQDVDLLFLCNLQRLSAAQTVLVRDFVTGGGGLILFPSPQADLNFFNRDLLPGLVPVTFKGVRGDPNDEALFQILDRDKPYHPLFRELLSDQSEDQAHFFASFELVPKERVQPMVLFADGRLALVAARRELGRVLLAAVPLSLAWNDLPLKGLFVPLMHRLVRELSLPADRHASYLVGQTVSRYLRDIPLTSRVRAETPAGNRLLLEPELIGGQQSWKIPRVRESGLWRLWREEQLIDQFPVNVDSRESVLTPVSRERLLQVFDADDTYFLYPEDDLRAKVLGNRHGRELWREFLALALILLFLELWIARAPHETREQAAEAA